MAYLKNVAGQSITFRVIDTTTNLPITTDDHANLSGQNSIDGAKSIACAGAFTEILASDNSHQGKFKYAMSQADTNGANLSFSFSSTTANYVCDDVNISTDAYAIGVAQTGDSYAIINDGTNGNAAIKTAIAGVPIVDRIRDTPLLDCPKTLPIPSSGTFVIAITLSLPASPDSAPTIAAANAAAASRSINLSSTTMSASGDIAYKVTYTADSTHAEEALVFTVSWTEGSVARSVSTNCLATKESQNVTDLHTALSVARNEPTGVVSAAATLSDKLAWMAAVMAGETDSTASATTHKNRAGDTIGTRTASDNGTVTISSGVS